MAWDLINEPRCESWKVPDCESLLQNWLEEMSAHIKQVDHKHLVTVGSEGFFGKGSKMERFNPQAWASQTGQNFSYNNLAKHVDFATIHVWPNNWDR